MLWEHQPTGDCFHSFFEFSQTSTSVTSITQKKCALKKNQLVYFDHQNVNSLCLCHHNVSSVFPSKDNFKPISPHIVFGLFSKCTYRYISFNL